MNLGFLSIFVLHFLNPLTGTYVKLESAFWKEESTLFKQQFLGADLKAGDDWTGELHMK